MRYVVFDLVTLGITRGTSWVRGFIIKTIRKANDASFKTETLGEDFQ
jgi:hypothetical protein